MKNLVSLVTREDVHGFVGALWRSDAFQKSYADHGFIYDAVERFAWLPRLFAESSNDELERAHFSTWWNVIMLRSDYTNPIIHDLYYLHEMTHASTMPYVPGIGREAFDEKMQRNELEASVASEIAIYFDMPALRSTSFNHPIYADRFLNNGHMASLWEANREVALETLRSMRRDVMVSKPEADMDLTEVWIRRFNDQNAVYSNVWANRYREVEQHLANFQNAVANAATMATTDRFRATALDCLRDWLETEAAKDAVDNIPFRREAELFAPFYWANKADYDAAMKAAQPKLKVVG